MAGQFKGKVALVTGGSTGLGRAAAVAFAREGAQCVITYNSSVDEANKTLAMIRQAGSEGIAVKADLTRTADAEAMVRAAVDTYGSLDFAYNNGFQARVAPVADFTEEEFDYTVSGVFKNVWACMKYEILQMRKQGKGAIVNCTSDAYQHCDRALGIYGASKAAVLQMSRVAAAENGPNIRINVACPGAFDTPAVDKGNVMFKAHEHLFKPEWLTYPADLFKHQAIPRMGTPEEFAPVVIFLCSDAASYITGANFVVDGGMLLR